MASQMQNHADVLHATDTALRLVNQALGDLGTADQHLSSSIVPGVGLGGAGSGSLLELSSTLLRAHLEVASLLDGIRKSRGVLQEVQNARLAQMTGKLAAVTSETEKAATGMLDGLERAISVVSELERDAAESEDQVRQSRYAALCEELYGVMAFVQFQDITSQQLGYASAVITETEQRLEELARIFAPFASDLSSDRSAVLTTARNEIPHDGPSQFDPNAVSDKSDAQAFADQTFGRS